MKILIIGIGLIIYCICPWYLQYVALFINVVIPDTVPYLDEIIMFGSFFYKYLKYSIDPEIKKGIAGELDTKEIVCWCSKCKIMTTQENTDMPSAIVYIVSIPFIVKALLTNHPFLAIWCIIAAILSFFEDRKRKKEMVEISTNRDFSLLPQDRPILRGYKVGYYECSICKTLHRVKAYEMDGYITK